MTTYIELCQYFEAIGGDVAGIGSITVGADEQTLDAQSGLITYPHFRVDTPEITFLNDDAADQITQFRFKMFLITNEPLNDYKQENTKLSAMLTLLKKIYKQIWKDADDGQFDLVVSPNTGDAIRHWSGDNCFGWFVNITINLYTADCT